MAFIKREYFWGRVWETWNKFVLEQHEKHNIRKPGYTCGVSQLPYFHTHTSQLECTTAITQSMNVAYVMFPDGTTVKEWNSGHFSPSYVVKGQGPGNVFNLVIMAAEEEWAMLQQRTLHHVVLSLKVTCHSLAQHHCFWLRQPDLGHDVRSVHSLLLCSALTELSH